MLIQGARLGLKHHDSPLLWHKEHVANLSQILYQSKEAEDLSLPLEWTCGDVNPIMSTMSCFLTTDVGQAYRNAKIWYKLA